MAFNLVETAYFQALNERVTDPRLAALAKEDQSLYLPLLYYTAKLVKPVFSVELGTGNGQSAAFLAAASRYVITVDPSTERLEERKVKTAPYTNIQFYEGSSLDKDVLELVDNKSVDLLFVDSLHNIEHFVEEIDAWTPKMRKGGVMLFDDVDMMPSWFECLPFQVKGRLDKLHPFGFGYAIL